jgi:hypothetical protein
MMVNWPRRAASASATIPKLQKKIQKKTTASAKILNGFGYKQTEGENPKSRP